MPSRRERAFAVVGPPTVRGSVYHIVYTAAVCIGGAAIALSFARDISAAEWLAVVPTFVLANLVEYAVHRWLMHRNVKPLAIMLKLHMVHHNYFDEHAYTLKTLPDWQMVVFPPIVLNMLTLAITLPLAGVAYLAAGMNVAMIFIATVMAYYLLMQVLHVAAHSPYDHWARRIPGIGYLASHHAAHHHQALMAQWNFNFIVPLADWVFGTATDARMSRSTADRDDAGML